MILKNISRLFTASIIKYPVVFNPANFPATLWNRFSVWHSIFCAFFSWLLWVEVSFHSRNIFFWPRIVINIHFSTSAANETKGYSSRYINDFNSTSFEPIYDYDNTKTEIDKVPLRQSTTKNDENMEIIYPDPDPEDFHRKMMNKTRMGNRHHDDTVIKICEYNLMLGEWTVFKSNVIWRYLWETFLCLSFKDTRRQPRKEKSNRLNHSQSLDSNNDDLNVSDNIAKS